MWRSGSACVEPVVQDHRVAPLAWSVVVPVKGAPAAKSRLLLPPTQRARLARAMALDTVSAALGCPLVHEVLVVVDDADLAAELTRLGATVVPDDPDAGLNAALVHGARIAREGRPGAPVAALLADLPALDADELTAALTLAAEHRHAFVGDAAGTGTTLWCAGVGAAFTPRFGPRSHAAHVRAGAAHLDLPCPTLRRDVDTVVDLWDAQRLGLRPRTAEVLAALTPPPATLSGEATSGPG